MAKSRGSRARHRRQAQQNGHRPEAAESLRQAVEQRERRDHARVTSVVESPLAKFARVWESA